MSKPRFTAGEHADAGRRLAFIHNELIRLQVQIENAYPRSGPEGRAPEQIRQAIQRLDRARSALDDALAREHPAEFSTRTYYPHVEDRAWAPATATGP